MKETLEVAVAVVIVTVAPKHLSIVIPMRSSVTMWVCVLI